MTNPISELDIEQIEQDARALETLIRYAEECREARRVLSADLLRARVLIDHMLYIFDKRYWHHAARTS